MPTLFGLKNCDSCKKARKWLDSNSVDYKFHDVREDGLSKSDLSRWLKKIDWEKLLNTRSTTWRGLDQSMRENVGKPEAIALMIEYPTLVKRPVIEYGGNIMVGFSEDQYRASFA